VLKDPNDPRSGPHMHTLMSSSYQHRLLEMLISLESLLVPQSHILQVLDWHCRFGFALCGRLWDWCISPGLQWCSSCDDPKLAWLTGMNGHTW
jgi:hypothetical protein